MDRRASRVSALGVTALVAALAALLPSTQASATPFYSVGSGYACNTCHIEPMGWMNPDLSERRCATDCQGCHISPTRGGGRTPLGLYYGLEVLPQFGRRPS